jgi:hypothetical protein
MQDDLTRLPFFAGFSLVVALRMVFGVPASATANWPFRLLAVAREGEAARVARRLIWLHLAGLVILPTAVFSALPVTFVLVLLHAVLIEALLLDFRQIPFTVRPAGFRSSRLVHGLLIVIGLGFVPWMGGGVAMWIGRQPARAVIPLLAAGAFYSYRRHAAEAMAGGKPALVFEDSDEDVIRLRL